MDTLLDIVRQKQERIEELRREIADLESELDDVFIALKGRAVAHERTPKPKSRHGFTNGRRAKPIKEGSSVWWSRLVLQTEWQPLPIDDLVEKVSLASGAPIKKGTLVSNLSRYVKHHDIFTRPAPNVFGLAVFEENTGKPSE